MAHRGGPPPVPLAAATFVCGSRVRGPPGLGGSRRTCRRRTQRARRSARATPDQWHDLETEKSKEPKDDKDDEMKLLTRKFNEMDSSIKLLVKQVEENGKKVETIMEHMEAETKLRDENHPEILAPTEEPDSAVTVPKGLYNEPGMAAKEPWTKSRGDHSEDDLRKLLDYADELNSEALKSVAEVANSLESLRNQVEFRHRMSDAIGSKLMEVLPRLKDTNGQLDLINKRVDKLEKGIFDYLGLEKKLKEVSDRVWKKIDFFERNEILARATERATERVYFVKMSELEDYINRRMKELMA